MHSIGIIGGADGPTAVFITGDFGLIGEHFQFSSLAPYFLILAAMVLIAYFIGNVSPATLLARAKGLDIKQEGSGNAGTTNALRVMGKKAGAITLVIDVVKGIAAVLLGQLVCGQLCAMLCVVAVVAGHIWPVVFKFKGGKGVATIFGAIVGLNILVALCALGILIIGVLISKRVSVGSILAAVSFPVFSYWLEPDFVLLACVLALIIIIKHRANIQRLFKGEEPKLSFFDKEKKK